MLVGRPLGLFHIVFFHLPLYIGRYTFGYSLDSLGFPPFSFLNLALSLPALFLRQHVLTIGIDDGGLAAYAPSRWLTVVVGCGNI